MSFFDSFRKRSNDAQVLAIEPKISQYAKKERPKQSFEFSNLVVKLRDAIRSDSILRQWVSNTVEGCMRHGFNVMSNDEGINKKLQERMREIEVASKTTMYRFVRTMLYNFIAYGNAYAVLIRNAGNSSGRSYTWIDDKTLEPISGVYPIDPLMVKIDRKNNGSVKTYQLDASVFEASLYINAKSPDVVNYPTNWTRTQGVVNVDKNDMVHIIYDENSTPFGRPPLSEVLEDVLALRTLEEVIQDMIRQNMYVITVYKVGTPDRPGKQQDIDAVKKNLTWNPSDGMLVMPGDHDIGIVSANIKDILSFIEYFKTKIYSAIGGSSVGFGEAGAANRATSGDARVPHFDKVRDMQLLFASFFQTYFLDHIVCDMGYHPATLVEGRPVLLFNEPDIETLTKKTNNSVFLYEHNVATFKETRTALGFTGKSIDEDLHLVRVTKQQAEFTAKAQADNSKETDNRTAPKNQHS